MIRKGGMYSFFIATELNDHFFEPFLAPSSFMFDHRFLFFFIASEFDNKLLKLLLSRIDKGKLFVWSRQETSWELG